ncbi:hypothetical protein B0T26DRAFT_745854 [Lasiosphaeria miniovina]|uniref:DUF1746 domain-containing protein n=1 Tax=Lasiosphaeria miniovina TaxID=1954250 RepID=A0AA40BGM2_9PEZI|nr:uncharacterized protein B0T26DRAFT_745854 [Lasiosphaeria miniovina]KAK0733870.1 hypothetical protein B0T26DRAFT_745854 [Lasiosphaeria miniovina]
MNNDSAPGSSSAAREPLQPGDGWQQNSGEDGGRGEPSAESGEGRSSALPSFEPTRKQKRREGLSKKLQFITLLQKSLDTVVFSYLCILYYMECSFPRLLLRLIPHYILLTPKEAVVSLPAKRPHVFGIFVPNILCMLFHAMLSLPRASESARGYLNGGIIIDFIGQKPATSKLGLLLFDIVILAVQCLMLAVHHDRERLRKVLDPSLPTARASLAEASSPTPPDPTQDLDAEERGIIRDEANIGEDSGGIELQSIASRANSAQQDDVRDPEDSGRMGPTYYSSATSIDLVDIMRSGSAILGNFHIVHAIRTIGNDYQAAAAYSLQSLGYNATLAALAAERRARVQQQQQ